MGKFIIQPETDIKAGIRKLMLDQMDDIQQIIGSENQDVNRSIHEIRRCFKKIRAVLRLLRDSIGYSAYYRENTFFRDLSRHLSEPRDSEVILQHARQLRNQLPKPMRNSQYDALLIRMESRRDKAVQHVIEKENAFVTISSQLELAYQRINHLNIRNEDFAVIQGGIYRIYRQNCQYLQKVIDTQEVEMIHNLRKRVKYLWFQMVLLKPIHPGLLKAYSKMLNKISENLGLFRDLILFREFIEESETGLDDSQLEYINNYVASEYQKVLHNALQLSRKFFIEQPSEFVEKIRKYRELSLIHQVI